MTGLLTFNQLIYSEYKLEAEAKSVRSVGEDPSRWFESNCSPERYGVTGRQFKTRYHPLARLNKSEGY